MPVDELQGPVCVLWREYRELVGDGWIIGNLACRFVWIISMPDRMMAVVTFDLNRAWTGRGA